MNSGNGGSEGPAIQATDVVKVYDSVTRALDGVNLTIARGEFVALMGPSGCGKSTLLHLLAALDMPTSGRIIVNGRDLRSAGNDRFRRQEIGLVFQLHNLLPNLTAMENVQIPMFGTGTGHAERLQRARQLLAEMDLSDKEKATPPRLSGGERQRLAIARALANNPSIILADEPTGNLDSVAVDHLLALFRSIRDEHGVTILLATHDVHVAEAADRTVYMRDGRIVESPLTEGEHASKGK
ncbi:MAG: ABC transporter ATP-binding protein [Dehalococcoidia bacterium]|jgi:putative ABC transport system ATP-binding protein